MPNTPWLNLVANDDPNDINFDVDQKFKFRMPTTQNYKGRDVKFNVKLPPDLLGGDAPQPPSPPAPPAPPAPPTPPTPPAPGPGPVDPTDPAEVPDVDAPIGLYQTGYDDYYDDEDYDDEYYDEEDGYGDEDDGMHDAYSTTPAFDTEYEQFAQDTQYWGRYESPEY